MRTVWDVTVIALPSPSTENGELVVAQSNDEVPFAIARVFTVRAVKGAVRGRHAHRECAQFLICVYGAVDVECDDGATKRLFALDRGNIGLLIPPSIWATEIYKEENSVLAVLCDRIYEETDYIRDYGSFLAWRQGGFPH